MNIGNYFEKFIISHLQMVRKPSKKCFLLKKYGPKGPLVGRSFGLYLDLTRRKTVIK